MGIPIHSIEGILSLFLASGIGVGGKIIYDYLKLTRLPKNKNGIQALKEFKLQCDKTHGGLEKSFEVIDGKIERLDVCVITEKIKLQKLGSEVDEHKRALERGIRKFDGIKADIVEMKTNIAILLDRANQRRKTDFSKGVTDES